MIAERLSLTFSLLDNYRPQTKFAKVMFLQVSVCPQGGACVAGEGGMHGWGGGRAWLGRGVCMAGEGDVRGWGGGHAWLGGMCGWGVCVAGGHVWLGGMRGMHTPPADTTATTYGQ